MYTKSLSKGLFLRTTTFAKATLLGLCLLTPHHLVQAESEKKSKDTALMSMDFESGITTITSTSLVLKASTREFVYSGNVKVEKDDMTLTAELLEGAYDESNQITDLAASKNVVIIQKNGAKATGENAVYDKIKETLTLTGSPEIQQNGSILSADKIIMFIKEDRSTAEGDVKVKLVEADKDGQKNQNSGGSPFG